MTITPEDIMAYVDGELDEAARHRVRFAALADSDVADWIARERALRDRLVAHFGPVAQAPVPAQWVDDIRKATAPHADVVDLAAARERRDARAARPRLWNNAYVGAAMAASLVMGLLVGTKLPTGPIVAHDGHLVASGDLARALDNQLASAQDGAAIRMLGTFRRTRGDLCRSFAGPQASGIACHDAGTWQLQHVLPGSAPSSATYRQAGSHDGELMAIAQGMAAGDPLDAAQEREARGRGWR